MRFVSLNEVIEVIADSSRNVKNCTLYAMVF